MKVLVICLAFVATVTAVPQGYSLLTPSSPSFGGGSCGSGQVQGADGSCVTAQVDSRVFLFDVPTNRAPASRPRNIPKPKVERNIVFVRIPEAGQGAQPVVVPPPRQEHVVYVLNKQTQQNQQTIEMPSSPPSEPEVYFVNYAEGDNPSLPIGVDLQTALNSAAQGSGQVVGGGGSGGGLGGGSGGGLGGGIGEGLGGGIGGGIGGGSGGGIGGGILSGSGGGNGGGIGGGSGGGIGGGIGGGSGGGIGGGIGGSGVGSLYIPP